MKRTQLTYFLVPAIAFGMAAPAHAQKTPWGDPDLQGKWSNATLTPLQRPADLGDKQFFTEEEAKAYVRQRIAATNDLLAQPVPSRQDRLALHFYDQAVPLRVDHAVDVDLAGHGGLQAACFPRLLIELRELLSQNLLGAKRLRQLPPQLVARHFAELEQRREAEAKRLHWLPSEYVLAC